MPKVTRMTTKVIGRKVVVFDECDSTNVRAAKAAFDGEKEGTVIVADHQSSGRGRRGRSWQSPPGTSLSMSIVLRPSMVPGPAPQITLVAAMAVAYAIDDLIAETEKKTEKTQTKSITGGGKSEESDLRDDSLATVQHLNETRLVLQKPLPDPFTLSLVKSPRQESDDKEQKSPDSSPEIEDDGKDS